MIIINKQSWEGSEYNLILTKYISVHKQQKENLIMILASKNYHIFGLSPQNKRQWLHSDRNKGLNTHQREWRESRIPSMGIGWGREGADCHQAHKKCSCCSWRLPTHVSVGLKKSRISLVSIYLSQDKCHPQKENIVHLQRRNPAETPQLSDWVQHQKQWDVRRTPPLRPATKWSRATSQAVRRSQNPLPRPPTKWSRAASQAVRRSRRTTPMTWCTSKTQHNFCFILFLIFRNRVSAGHSGSHL